MVTLRRESLQLSQSLSVCFISLFTENNAVEEIWFYKTQKILKKSCKPNMPLLGAKKRRIDPGSFSSLPLVGGDKDSRDLGSGPVIPAWLVQARVHCAKPTVQRPYRKMKNVNNFESWCHDFTQKTESRGKHEEPSQGEKEQICPYSGPY